MGQVIFEIDEPSQVALVEKRRAQDGFGSLRDDIGIMGEIATLTGIVQHDRLAAANDIVDDAVANLVCCLVGWLQR